MFKTPIALTASCLFLMCLNSCASRDEARQNAYDVKAFGAKGDGVSDDAPAVKAAIEAAMEAGAKGAKATVFIPKGSYSLATAYGERQMLSFKGIKNVGIEGEEGSLFLVRDPMRGFFEADGGSDISFKKIAIDYAPLTFTQFKVLGDGKSVSDGKEFSLELLEGYPEPSAPHLAKKESIIGYKADGSMNLEAPLLKIKSMEAAGERRYKAVLAGWQGSPDFVQPGDFLVMNGRHFGRSVFRFNRLVNPSLEEVKVHAGPEVFILSAETENLQVRNCRIAPPEGSGRLMSTSADGIFNVGGRKGPTIEGCYFSGNGDDSVNIHHTGGLFYGFSSEGELLVTETPWTVRKKDGEAYKPLWRAGDRVELVNSKFEKAFSAKIVSLSCEARDGRDALRVKIEPAPGGEEFVKANPESKTANKDLIVFNLDNCGAGFSIKNNVFTNHRARGILLQSHDGVVEGNTFSKLDGGVMLVGEWHYKDGPLARDIQIRRNSFVDIGHYISDGAISISICGGGCQSLEYKNILIEGNSFLNSLKPAIYIDNASDIDVRGNDIRYPKDGKVPKQITTGSRGPVKDIRESGNTISPMD